MRDERYQEVPHDAVVARHGVEVGLRDLVRRAVGDEVDEGRAGGGVVRERRQAAVAGAGNGAQLTLGGVLEEVLVADAGNEAGGVIRLAGLAAKPCNGSGLAQQPLLARYAAAVRGVGGHRFVLRCLKLV